MNSVVTTDGASNMAAGIAQTDGFYWLRCVCHAIHLAVQDGEAYLANERDMMVLPKVKKFVTAIH